ncbi:MAG: M23 family metallopeptidase [Treponema sp.]|jgi:murein DD-endopeptidase MepM/ murein hydrolase activator NlpD|nr:M23 family metallopeptidase [Treponema sp.]
MTFTLPEGWDKVEAAYSSIEGRKGGQYPIGLNRCWHSGVHSHGYKPVSPMIKGKIVACRLTDSFAVIPRLGVISKIEWEGLNRLEQFFYEKKDEEEIYTLKYEQLGNDEINQLEEKIRTELRGNYEDDSIKRWLREEGGVYEPIEKVSTEYVLVKHEVSLPEYKERNEKLNFFTLYMGIFTHVAELEQYYKDFCEVREPITDKIPVFQKWKFRLNYSGSVPEKLYKKYDTFNVFEYSTFSFKLCDDNIRQYNCTFTNDKRDGGLEKLWVDDIEPTSVQKYKTNKDRVQAFKIPQNGTGLGINTATVKINRKFLFVEPWDNTYYKVIVDKSDCDSYNSNLCGWVRNMTNGQKTALEPMGSNQLVYTITRREEIPSNYLFMTRGDYHKARWGNISVQNMQDSAQAELIVIKNRTSETSYSFYYIERKLGQITVDDSDFRSLTKGGTGNSSFRHLIRAGDISIYEWRNVANFGTGDYAYAQTNNTTGGINTALPPFVIRNENISFCRFSYPSPEEAKHHNALILKSDLSPSEGFGYIKPGAGIFENKKINGCILYETYVAGQTPGNAMECLGEQEAGGKKVSEVFESDAPYVLLRGSRDNRIYQVNYKGNKGYVYIDGGITIEAKIEYEDVFKDRDNIIKPDKEVGQSDILGYPAPIPRERDPFCDIALFFTGNDNEFFSDRHWADCPKTQSFIKPLNFNGLYSNGSTATSKKYYFSAETVFAYIKEEEAYKLQLKSVHIHINKSCLDGTPEDNKKIKIKSIPDDGQGQYCYFNETQIWENIEKNSLEVREFAKYFNSIRPLLRERELTCISADIKKHHPQYPLLEIDLSDIPNTAPLILYTKINENGNYLDLTGNTATVKSSVTNPSNALTLYEENPSDVYMLVDLNLDKNRGLKPEREIGNFIRKVQPNDSGIPPETYYEFKIDQKSYYVPERDGKPSGLEPKNYLDFPQFFSILEGSESDDNIVCDYTKIVEKITDKELDFKELMDLYRSSTDENLERREKLHRLVCQHPFEWNKALYDDGFVNRLKQNFSLTGERLTNLVDKMEKQDLWANPKEGEATIDELPKGQVWFAHPVYFINHLDKAGLLDRTFNPYENKEFTSVRQWTIERICERFIFPGKVYDNPGFAPRWEAHNDGFEGNVFDGYAVPTGFFNQQYYNTTKKETYRHEGVDFRGSSGKEVVSFIYGKVINAGWLGGGNDTYGRVLIVANTRDEGIYMLAHLSRIANGIQRGSIIEPNDVVAYVGGSGNDYQENRWVSHLHISYYCGTYDVIKDSEGGENQYVVENNRKLVLRDELFPEKRRNPFKHDEVLR